MKRFNCTLSDKRGEFGECMETNNTGRYVLFSDVEKLQRSERELLDKFNSTGVAVERAISTGSVLADHPLKSRLELLANALADGMVVMADHCKSLTYLLQKAVPLLQSHASDLHRDGHWGEADDIRTMCLYIEDALDGTLPDPTVKVTETIRTAPERIWLQVGDQEHYHSEPFPSDTSGVSWCADSVVGCEVPYVRADLVGKVPTPVVPEGWRLVPADVPVEGEWVANYEPNIHYRHEARAEILTILAAAPKPEDKP